MECAIEQCASASLDERGWSDCATSSSSLGASAGSWPFRALFRLVVR